MCDDMVEWIRRCISVCSIGCCVFLVMREDEEDDKDEMRINIISNLLPIFYFS